MSDPTVPPPPQSVPASSSPNATAPAPSASDSPTSFDIGEEYGTARKNLPPARILAICIAVVAVIIAAYSLTHRAHPLSSGSVDDVVAIPFQGQDMVMVAINVSIQNNEQKPTWIKAIQVAADVNGTKLTDDAAPAVDAQRYFQAMPDLKQHALDLITTETRIDAGSKIARTIVVSFPVKAEEFNARKSLTVTVTPYDELPIVMTK
jgi:hypothetical protein